jgi:hypothetical protein
MVDKTTKHDDHIASAVQRSMPREGRPRLGTELEEKLSGVEHRAAAQYASMEDFARRLNSFADGIDSGEIELSSEDIEIVEAVPDETEFEDSMVHNIEDVRAKLLQGTRPAK